MSSFYKMYHHIVKAKFLKIEVNKKTFERIFAKRLNELILEKNQYWQQQIQQPNEFIRILYSDDYMDISIQKIDDRSDIIIFFGKIIDCSRAYRENK